MKIILLILFFGLSFVATSSQCVNSSSAETFQNGVSMSHIIGQTVVAESENGLLSTGIISSYQIMTLTGNELIDVILATVYPNPTKDILILKTGDIEYPCYRITDINGMILVTGVATEEDTKIDFSIFTSGIYYLSVYGKESAQKTFKIIKK